MMRANCDTMSLMEPVMTVMRFDLETLARDFTFEERLEFYNIVKGNYKKYLMGCAGRLDRDVDILYRGQFLLARLLLAAAFRMAGDEVPEITGRYREEEYNLIFDFEEMKIFDYLSVEDIVEFIERREGKVYELVKKYYDRQYYLLDTKWAKLMGPMAKALNERYKERRRRIEEAVITYIKKRTLTLFIREIEEAVQKVLESASEKRAVDELAARLEERLARLEEQLAGLEAKSEFSSVEPGMFDNVESGLSELQGLVQELEEARRRLEEKEREIEALSRQYHDREAAYEILVSEAESLRARIRELEEKLADYKSLVEALRLEKSKLESRVEELSKAMRGELEGHLVSAEEAWALEHSLVQRVLSRVGEEAVIYDPLRRETRRIKKFRKSYYSSSPESRPSGLGVVLEKYKGVVRKSRDIVVDAATLVHVDSYKEKGYDARPIGLYELLDHLEQRLSRAEAGGYYHIIIVSSPTGFTEKALSYVQSQGVLGFVSKYVTLYLVDPIEGKVYYNADDPAADANKHIAEPWLDEERVNEAVRFVMSDKAKDIAVLNSSVSPFITSDEVARETGLSHDIIRRAFSVLEKQGVGRVEIVKGKAAFIYTSLST